MREMRPRPRQIAARALDAIMTALSVVLMGGVFLFPDDIVHEAIGTALIVLWVLHHALNRWYYKSLFKGKYTARRAIMLIVNSCTLVASALLAISGIILSNRVFRFLGITGGLAFARAAHLVASHWHYALIAFHFALHVPLIFGRMGFVKRAKERGGAARALLAAIPLAISAYGAYAFALRGFARYMFFRQEFFFFDLERGYLLFAIDYISIFVMCATIFHWLCRLPDLWKGRGRRAP